MASMMDLLYPDKPTHFIFFCSTDLVFHVSCLLSRVVVPILHTLTRLCISFCRNCKQMSTEGTNLTTGDDFYVRYYVGHEGTFGHEFLEFELRPDGLLRYANNSEYKKDSLIRKEVSVSDAVMGEIKRIVDTSHIIQEDDKTWPEPNEDGRQELEIVLNGQHISFVVRNMIHYIVWLLIDLPCRAHCPALSCSLVSSSLVWFGLSS